MKNILLTFCLLSAVVTVLVVIGCSDSSVPANDGSGRIRLTLIDAPGDFEAVNVQVVGVRVHRSDAADTNKGWFDIAVDTTIVDLLSLTEGNGVLLADSELPAGHYTQVRLMLGDANTVVVDGETHPLQFPRGSWSGLKLNHPFDIEEGVLYEATLDFDADRSIHKTGSGKYKMIPVVRIVVNRNSGGIVGAVAPVDARARVWTLAGLDTVTAWADTLTGEFGFPLLHAGSYDLTFEASAGAYQDSTLGGVVVEVGLTTDVGLMMLQPE